MKIKFGSNVAIVKIDIEIAKISNCLFTFVSNERLPINCGYAFNWV